mmetsp:Transcript_15314/g.17328  ORF Transcript_15314/g.17328 Transcript_15314/m.17328 type:complete len:97 (+) Transcript_15314:170-460(+)
MQCLFIFPEVEATILFGLRAFIPFERGRTPWIFKAGYIHISLPGTRKHLAFLATTPPLGYLSSELRLLSGMLLLGYRGYFRHVGVFAFISARFGGR